MFFHAVALSHTDLHSEDESLIDTKGLLRGDQERGDAGDGARREEALIVNLSDNSLVRTVQHTVSECTHTVPAARMHSRQDSSYRGAVFTSEHYHIFSYAHDLCSQV